MAPRISRQRGFTLIELLIVIGIIVALIGILVPSLAHAKKVAMKAAAQQQLGALQTALATYYGVFHAYGYPSSSTPSYAGAIPIGRGGAMLAEGLVGYLDSNYDGAGPSTGDGLGFRVTKNAAAMGGQVYGPYASTDSKGFKVSSSNPTDQYFIDPWGNEILYYRSTQELPAQPTPVTTIFGTSKAIFISTDCSVSPKSYGPNPDPAATGTPVFFKSLGATSNNAPSVGVLGADSFLLISAGPDGVYFTDDDIVAGKQ